MPRTWPLVSAVNFTPRLPGKGSPESVFAGVAKSKIVLAGAIVFEADDAGPVPRMLVADTVNV